MRFLKSPINILMITLVAGMFVGSIPAYAGSAASSAVMQYEKGMISEAELDKRLQDIGYSDEEIRQVKAVSGGLKHQQEGYVQSEPVTTTPEENLPEKTSKVSADEADNIMLVMGIGGAAMAVAIAVAFSKRTLSS